VGGRAESGDGHPAHDDPIADEGADEDDCFALPAAIPQVEEAGDQVADGDALKDAIDAQGSERKVGKAVDDQAEAEEDCRAFYGLPGEF